MASFLDELKKNIADTLNTISSETTDKVIEILKDIGVEGQEDLVLIREEDLKSVLKPIQIRRLLQFWGCNVSAGKSATKLAASKGNDSKELQEDLKAIIDALKSLDPADERDRHTEWKKIRVQSIEVLHQLADGLDTYKSNCNKAKVFGSSVGLAGGVASTAGAVVLIATTGGLAAIPIAIVAGAAAGALGGLAVAGTTVAEIVIEKRELEKAKCVLENDRTEFEKLFHLVKRSKELEHAVEKIMSVNIFEAVIEAFQRMREKLKRPRDQAPTMVPIELKNALKELCIPKSQQMKLIDFFITVCESPECMDLFRAIVDIYQEVKVIFQRSMPVINLLVKGFCLLDASVDARKAAFDCTRSATIASKTVVPLVALGAVSIAIDVVTLISTSKDMVKGSKSELAVQIRNCAIKLEEELCILQEEYDTSHDE